MIYNMNKPSENMLLSTSELAQMIREQNEELYKAEQEKQETATAAAARDREEFMRQHVAREQEMLNDINERAILLDSIKESFVSECLYKLYKESCGFPLTSTDKVVAKNLVNKFVKENGAWDLLNSFGTKNILLSEFYRICNKYYDRILENESKQECCDIVAKPIVDPDTIDDFYRELEDVDTEDAAKMIKDRVADAVTDFIDSNAASKVEYEEIIKQAQDKVAAINGDEAVSEEYLDTARRTIMESRVHKERNMFGYMVEALTTSVFKDDTLREKYIHEASVDMDGIVNSAQLIYTMLEMVNTTEMIRVNEQFISDYLNSL